ncbi:flagellar hook-associated protein FlgL [candidate division KSB1 bacterium]
MRVTDSYRVRTVIGNLNMSRDRLNVLQQQLASAKRINRPSDDPIGATRSMRLRSTLESNQQYDTNIEDALGYLSATEAAMNDSYNLLLEVRDLALKGSNDATSDREDLANNLDLILENMVEIGNTKFKGKYLFGGTETLSNPFSLDQNVLNQDLDSDIVVYYGNSDVYKRQINEHTAIDLNIPGNGVFDMTDTNGVSIFQEIYNLRNVFKENPLKINRDDMDESMDNITTAMDQLLNAFLEVGTKKQMAVFNQERFELQNISVREQLSKNEDTDFGTAYVQFKAEENALNSALSAGARVISPSLLDFLS